MIDLRTRLVLNSDVVIRDSTTLRAVGLGTAAHEEFVLTRTGSRAPSLTVSRDAAELALAFARPVPLLGAVATLAKRMDVDATELLEGAYPTLQVLLDRRVLVRPAAARRRAPERIGDYTLERTLNDFEETSVYLAKDARGAFGALKLARTPMAAAHVERERRVYERIAETVAPMVLEAGACSAGRYLVTEWIAGVPAIDYFAELRAAASRHRLLNAAADVVDAFHTLHGRGVLHGDVQPKNVLFDLDDRVWLVDFTHSIAPGVEAPHGRMGVPFFFEPEHAASLLGDGGGAPVTREGEIYAIGALLFYLLSGVHYVEFSLDREPLLEQIASEKPRPLVDPEGRPWPAPQEILAPCLEKAPHLRPKSLEGVSAQLRRAAAEIARVAPAPRTRSDDPIRILRRDFGLGSPRMDRFDVVAPRCSLSYGAAGIAYALLRASSIADDPALLAAADAWVELAEKHATEADAFTSQALGIERRVIGYTSLSNAEPGLFFAKALVRRAAGDARGASEAVESFLRGASRTITRPTDVNLGGLGLAIAAWRLAPSGTENQRARLGALRARLVEGGWARWGARIARRRRLGFAHGVGGLVFATLLSRERGPVEELAEELRRRAVSLRRGVHWPVRDGTSAFMPGWCNGVAGHALAWLFIWQRTGAERDREMLERAAWGVWESRTSIANVCCGAAGQALALAQISSAVGDPHWRTRARAMLDGLKPQWTRDDHPQSLFRGELGLLLARLECADACAAFPVYGG